MIALTAATIADACDCRLARAENWRQALIDALQAFGIDTAARVAAFLAQVAHESGRLAYVAEIWGPTIAQRRYEWRVDLGNTQEGDGYRYRGRGLIQITGRANYIAVREGLRRRVPGLGVPDFEAEPQRLEAPSWAAMSAAWFWNSRRLNELADAGDFTAITRRINGGTNGQADREQLWAGAKVALANAA